MKKLLQIAFLLFNTLTVFSQEDSKINEALSKIDTTVIKGKSFINKSKYIKGVLDVLKTKEKNIDGSPIFTLTPRHFEMLTSIVAEADLGNNPKKKEILSYQNLKHEDVTKSNIVPIGIINSEAVFLSEMQLEENMKSKSQNKKADNKDYEYFDIIVAGLLQGEVFQSDIQFRISPELMQSNSKNEIKGIEIDFQDGRGFISHKWKEQLIPYKFKTTGKVTIAIKLITKKGNFITYNILDIKQLERPKPFGNKNIVNTNKVIFDSIKGAKINDVVTGGEYSIFTGCDGVFDKPIIIAEGFDVGQDVGIDDMVAKYFHYLYTFRNNGYDLVFVNYNDGRDYMQNNAEVLKRVIREVNTRKVGNNKLVVVGESMSGLIARYALKGMENAGETHNVSHFVAFDSPMQGANVPPGLIALRQDLYGQAGWIFGLLANIFSPEVRALNTPAAKQLLLYSTPGLNKDPLFDSFRQSLTNLGNGGYPNQAGIRNIALINGALNGSQFKFGTLITPGDKILEANLTSIICNNYIDVWSNNLNNENTKVYKGLAISLAGLLCGTSFNENYFSSNKNLDRLAGGYIASGSLPLNISNGATRFSFVPAYSAVDYKGVLNSDNDYNLVINGNIINANTFQVINSNLTPFSAIYGNNTNNEHSISANEQEGWNNLAIRENFGILNSTSVLSTCNLPAPQVVKEAYIINRGSHYKWTKN